jgi:hypothetical protein
MIRVEIGVKPEHLMILIKVGYPGSLNCVILFVLLIIKVK